MWGRKLEITNGAFDEGNKMGNKTKNTAKNVLVVLMIITISAWLMPAMNQDIQYSYAASGTIPVYDVDETSSFPAETITISTSDKLGTSTSNGVTITNFGITKAIYVGESATLTPYCNGNKVSFRLRTSSVYSNNTSADVAKTSSGTYELSEGTYYIVIDSSNYVEAITGSPNVTRTAQVYAKIQYHHSFDQSIIRKNPTCSEEGIRDCACSACGKMIAQRIPKLAHSWVHIKVQPKVGVKGSEYDQCVYCKTIKNKKTIAALVPKGTSITKLTKAKKAFTVKWRKQAVQTTGYQIQYALNSAFTSNKRTVTVSGAGKTSQKIKNLAKKKKYYVRIRTYKKVNGVKYYSAWSAKKSVKTK